MVDVDDEVARAEPLEDVARDDAPEGLRAADADRPEQLPVGHEDEAVRAALEAAVQAALDEDDGAGRRRLGRVDDGRGMTRLVEQLRETRRLVAGEDDPTAVALPRLHRAADRRSSPRGQDWLAPAEHVAGAQAARRERRGFGLLRLPRQLERPARDEPRLPRPRPDVGGGPVLRQVAGLDQLGPALVRLAPEELRGFGDVARLVETRGRGSGGRSRSRARVGGPDLGGVADCDRPAGRRRRARRGALALVAP